MIINEKVMIGDRLKTLIHQWNLFYPNENQDCKDLLISKLMIKESTFHKYLNNERRPTIEMIIEISRFFCVDVDYLLSNSNYDLDCRGESYISEFRDQTIYKLRKYLGVQNLDSYFALSDKELLLNFLYLSDTACFSNYNEDDRSVLFEKVKKMQRVIENISALSEMSIDLLDELLKSDEKILIQVANDTLKKTVTVADIEELVELNIVISNKIKSMIKDRI